MECGQCGEENREGARFCSGCGNALARHCINCQAEVRPTAKFCDECGTSVGNASSRPTAPAAPAATATRKIVTALFADLVGSTSFGERTDAEVARSVMARYHALLQDAIDAHGGTVAKFMGDGMMATFGIPEIAEDDALRAVRAGVDIQRRFTDFAAEVAAQHNETLGLRVGVNTGEVVIASGDADLVGDALNVAARIEHACRPGNVTVGEETWRLTRGEFGYESLGEVTVAGRAQAVSIYEVVAGGTVEVETAAPFVGRASEMAALRRAFDAATASHSARLVTVLGSPGVGKTRLSRELCTAVAADENAITIELRCDRAGDATFAPIAQLIRDATDLGDDPDPASTREKLGTLLADDEPDRERLVDVFAGLVGAAPSRSVEETFWGVRRLVSASARDRPMIVVIDDIQWAEPLFLDLLEHLAEWVQDVPLLLLCLARPELRDVRPSLAERNRRVEDVIALDGLDSAATEALAAGLLGTDRLPAGLVERLPTSTDGNPLFVRELVRMLVDDQVIRRRGDEWELAIDADAVEVPPTIQSLLAARVERLPDDERTLLELASVIGSEFNLGALRELAGVRTPLPTLLEAMRRKELVEPTGAYWGDEPVHRFHHVLIRDAAYRRLLKTTRADLHEQVAVWTDAAAAGLIGEHEAIIAFHYEQAYRYRAELGRIDDHVTGLGRRAAELLSGASDRALGQDDLAAAGALARRALALLPATDASARAELLTTACECTLSSGDVAGARPVVEQLRTEASNDPTLGAWASCFEAQLVGLTDPEGLVGAEATATGAAKVMEELGDGAGEAKAHQVRAGLLARLGRVGDAELELDLALGAARRVDDRRRVTAVLGTAPVAALWGPSPVARAGGRCLDVVRLLRITTASPSVEATSMRCQAVLEALRGRFDVARSMLDSSRATLEELGLRHGLLETAYLTGVVELVAGDPAAAIGPLRDAYDGLIEMGVGIDAGRAAALLAHALVLEGRVDDAEPMAAASEELAGQDLKTAIAWRVARAEVLAARGDVAGGIALAKEAVDIAAATDLVIDHADACVALALLHRQAGDLANSRSVRDEAKRLYDLKGATVPAERLAADAVVTPAPIAAATHTPTSVPDDTDPRHPRAENAMSVLFDRFLTACNDGRLDDVEALIAPDYHDTDRRTTVSIGAQDRTGFVAVVRAGHQLGLVLSYEPLAVRGDRLFLARGAERNAGGDEIVMLCVVELDAEGHWASSTWFDPGALADALAELDARYLEGEGAASAATLRVGLRGFAAMNARDWDGSRDVYTPDFVCTDRRQIGWPTVDRDGLVATIREYTELAPDLFLLTRKVEVRGAAFLGTLDAFGTTPDGGAVEWVLHTVTVAEPTGISSNELFDEDDFPAALARFDQLGAAEPSETRTAVAENDAATVLAKAWELIVTDRVDEIGLMCAEDAVVIDGQRIIGEDLVGRDAIVANGRAVAALGADAARVEPLAVRGSRLALCRTIVSFGGFENVFLSVGELDHQGLARCIVTFDEDSLVDALDELDARYYAGEGAQEGVLFSDFPIVNLVNRRDWSAILDPDFPKFTQVDHRQLGWPTVDREGWVATMQQYVELVPDLVMVVRKFHQRGSAALTTLDPVGTTLDGATVAWAAHTVISVDPDGRIRMDTFDLDDFAAALARLDELGAAETPDPRHPRAENTATRTRSRILEHFNQGRFAQAQEMLTDDFERVDHRTVVSMPTTRGRDTFLVAVKASLDVGFAEQSHVPLAIRGDRLELSRVTMHADGRVLVFLNILEVDESGRLCSTTSFDEHALDDATAELDARYVMGEGAPHAPMLATGIRTLAALQAEEWTTLTSLLTDDYTFVDHRQLSNPSLDREGYVAIQQLFAEQIRRCMLVRTLHPVAHAFLCTFDVTGTDAGGGAFEWGFHLVSTFDGENRIAGSELFDEVDFPAALARLDELATVSPADPRHPRVENATTHTVDRFFDLAVHGRFDDAAHLLSPEIVRVDHRTSVSDATTHGRDEYMTALRATFDVGFAAVTVDHLAVRGERFNLMRTSFTTDAGLHLPILSVCETDIDGLVAHISLHDDDALDAAVAELEDRYIAGEGAQHADLLEAGTQVLASLRSEDWERLRTLLSDDFTFVDNRLLSNPTLDREEYVAMQQAVAEQIRQHLLIRSLHVSRKASLLTFEATGTDAAGGTFEWIFHLVAMITEDRRIKSMDLFDEDDFAAALTRLDELGSAAVAPTVENSVTRLNAAWVEAKNTGRSAELEHLIAPDYTVVSRRFGGIVPASEGVEEMRTLSSAGDDVGFTSQTMVPVAVRGDRLALTRLTATTADGLISERLEVTETDEQGRFARTEIFEVDALADALVTLDRWYATGEGAEHADVIEVLAEGYAAMNRRDLDAWAAIHAPDHTTHDHAPIGFGELGTQKYGDYLQAAFEQVPGFVFVPATIEVNGHVALVGIPVRATTPEGFEFEKDLIVVTRFAPDLQVVEDHMFAAEQWAEARAMFEMLSTSTTRAAPQIRNNVTHALDRYAARLAAGDVSLEGISADDILLFDRRRGISAPTFRGRAAVEANISAILEMFDTVSMEHLAIRGDHVALIRLQWTHEGFTLPILAVYESDEDGLVIRATTFDDEDLDLALALDELEERFIAGEGAEHEFAILRAGDVRRGAGASDRAAAYKALHTPDCRVTDHRLLSWPTETVSDVVDQIRADRGISAPRTTVFATLEVLGDAVLITQDDYFVTPEGSEYLKRSLVITHSIAGLADSLDYFDPEQHEAARARFAELGNETRTPYVDNAVVRALVRSGWLVQVGDLRAAVDTIAEDIVAIDHRSGVAGLHIVGRDDYVTNQIEIRRLLQDLHIDWVAVRGDRLALAFLTWTSEGGDELVHYATFEIDDAGRTCRNDQYDDLATALTALDARYAEISGAAPTDVEAALLEGVGLLNRREWDGFAARFHPDFVAVDHSPLGFPTTGRDGFVNDQMRGMAEVVPDFVVVLRKILTEGRATLLVGTTLGTTVDGNAYTWEFVQVMQAAADGRGLHRDLYADTQWTDALARFDEWSSPPTAPVPDNTAVRTWAGIIRARAGNDPSTAIHLVAPDVVGIDRRAGISTPDLVGRDAVAANAMAVEELFGVTSRTFDVIEVRGDRLALLRAQVTNAEGFGISGTMVVETNQAGEMIRCVYFDEDALADALAELEARDAAIRASRATTELAAAPENRLTRQLRESIAQLQRGEVTGSVPLDDDVVIMDRRSGVSAGTISGRDDFLANARAHFDVFARARPTVLAVRGDRLALIRMEFEADGFVSARLNLFETDEADRLVALVVRDEDALADALDELDARHAAIESAGENRATFAGRRSIDAFVRGDRAAALDAFAPGFIRSDRRRGPNIGETVGREEYVDATLAGADVGMAHFKMTPIEIAGDDHSLTATRWHNGDGFELEWLLVTEVDADGRILRVMNFDVDERDAASAVLHQWAAEAPEVGTLMTDSSAARMDALARGDREAVLATYTADFVREDRRRGINFGASNREETVDALLAGNDVGLGNRTFTAVEAIGDNFALGEFRMSHDDGFELIYLLAIEQDDEGRLRRATNFDLEDRALASALLHLWAAERGELGDPPANAMTRALEAFPVLYAARDWDRFAAAYTDPAIVVDDRRPGVSAGIVPGREAVMHLVRGLDDVGFRTVTNVPVAVRGDRLALFRRVWHNTDGLDLPMLVLVQAAPSGLVGYQIMWSIDEVEIAVAELDRRASDA